MASVQRELRAVAVSGFPGMTSALFSVRRAWWFRGYATPTAHESARKGGCKDHCSERIKQHQICKPTVCSRDQRTSFALWGRRS